MSKRKTVLMIVTIIGLLLLVMLFLGALGNTAHAAGLVDDSVKTDTLYSKYRLDHYQLDFYVDSSWDWLPWNWSDGIGKSVMYGLYAITNFIWTVSLYLSNATGYVIQEAYKLDFISDTANAIGKNIQTLAGVSRHGFANEGFYVGFLLLFILIVGAYVAYVGLIKRESSKTIHAVLNFLGVFLLSASFIAFAPDYITKLNDFSSDISASALSLGTKIVVPNSKTKGQDSVVLIRESLFSVQVEQPWLLLQYGDSDKGKLGAKRVDNLLSVDPDANNGKDREEAVKTEINEHENKNLSLSRTMNRLGTVVFLFLFNLGISVFIFLLTGILIFSQILFIIFAMFLPISFLLSMLPTYEGMAKRSIEKLFNTIMMRAGVTLVITTAFSISSMFYSLSNGYPFFMVAFLQIVTFAGIYFKLGDLMNLFRLQSADSQQLGRRVLHRPQRIVDRGVRKLRRSLLFAGVGTASIRKKQTGGYSPNGASDPTINRQEKQGKESKSKEITSPAGTVSGTSSPFKKDTGHTRTLFNRSKNTPLNDPTMGVNDIKEDKKSGKRIQRRSTSQRQNQQQTGEETAARKRQTIAEKRTALDQVNNERRPTQPNKKLSSAIPVRKNMPWREEELNSRIQTPQKELSERQKLQRLQKQDPQIVHQRKNIPTTGETSPVGSEIVKTRNTMDQSADEKKPRYKTGEELHQNLIKKTDQPLAPKAPIVQKTPVKKLKQAQKGIEKRR